MTADQSLDEERIALGAMSDSHERWACRKGSAFGQKRSFSWFDLPSTKSRMVSSTTLGGLGAFNAWRREHRRTCAARDAYAERGIRIMFVSSSMSLRLLARRRMPPRR
ncbi:hypothetical protein [Reyranella sp.]|uniref:hypothetical protein n=1 Tax=Reyranella sp. TaxID=1929291 RepID=UPI003D0ACA9D